MRKIALLYWEYPKIPENIIDHLRSFGLHSEHAISYISLNHKYVGLPHQVFQKKTLENFDAIVIHYTIFMIMDHMFPPYLRAFLRHLNTKKIVFIQDEYRQINKTIEILKYIKADLLFTCFPEKEIEKVYCSKKLPLLKKIPTLTGFIPEQLLLVKRLSYEERFLDVVYRARKLPSWYGHIGKEKWHIAEKFNQEVGHFSLKSDVSCEENKRLYGKEWMDFLSSSKAALGSESGASVCDFTGEIQKNVERYEESNPHASFEEIENLFFPGLDGKINFTMISPRYFECASLGTLMILYEGHYSGILIPWRHYLPLKKDHSNMKEIVSILKDKKQWEKITEAAYKEIVCNPAYSYKEFIRRFDREISTICDRSASSKNHSAISGISIKRNIKTRSTFFYIVLYNAYRGLNKMGPTGHTFVSKVCPLNSWHSFFREIYRAVRAACGNYYMFHLRVPIVRIILNAMGKGTNFFRENLLVLQVLGYCEMVRDLTGKSLLSVEVRKKEIILLVGEDIKSSAKAIDSLEDIPSTFSLRLLSSSSVGLPENLRNLDCRLKHGQKILEILK